jgi:hypothetical protein
MGGNSLALRDESSFSLSNPASLAWLKYSTMETGISFERVIQNTSEAENIFTKGKMNYFALGLPLSSQKALGFNFGLSPISEVGYFLQSGSVEDSANIINTFDGKGGLTALNFGLGYGLTKGLSVGINADFVFGNINDIRDKQYFQNTDYFSYRDEINSSHSGVKWNFGVQYNGQVSKAIGHQFGFTFSPPADLSVSSTRLARTYNPSGNFYIDTLINTQNDELKLTLPVSYGLAYNIGNMGNWMLGVEYQYQGFAAFTDLRGAKDFRNFERYSFGGYYQFEKISDGASTKAKSKGEALRTTRIYYGLSYTKGYLDLYAEPINELGIGFGFGIPVINKVRTTDGLNLKVVSRLNIGFNYRIQGTTENDLLEENIWEFQLGLTLSDKWFNQRKYQ